MGFRVPVEPHFEHATRLGSRKIAPHDEHFWPSRCGFEPSFRKGTTGRGPESVAWACSAMKIPPNDGYFSRRPSAVGRVVSVWREVSHSHLTPSTRRALNISNPNGHGAQRDWTGNGQPRERPGGRPFQPAGGQLGCSTPEGATVQLASSDRPSLSQREVLGLQCVVKGDRLLTPLCNPTRVAAL